MAAERPTTTGRSRFGSVCATSLACLCLAYGFAGCLNPLTDDQPANRPNASPSVTGGGSSPPSSSGSGPTTGPDFIIDDEGQGAPGISNPNGDPQAPAAGDNLSGAGDAGVELDAGPTSSSVEVQ